MFLNSKSKGVFTRKEIISGSITRAVYARLAADGIVGVFRSKDFHSIQTSSPALSTN